MIHERLVAYRNSTQRLPEHILFYRDGVSESQYGMVKLRELPLIEAGCSKAGLQFLRNPSWYPSITLLVVGKRDHTRFFKLDPDNSNTANLPSGLVVDTEVVDPTCSNFTSRATILHLELLNLVITLSSRTRVTTQWANCRPW